jgi:uncharacterized protein
MPASLNHDSAAFPRRKLKFRRVAGTFAICRLPPDAPLPGWAGAGAFLSIARTAEELSIACLSENVPVGVRADRGWACLKVEGTFAFQEIGILASFIGPLAENGIPIFAVSTFDTDYVLIKEELVGAALSVLARAGHQLL